jgi:SAM-dependent methyltransferase
LQPAGPGNGSFSLQLPLEACFDESKHAIGEESMGYVHGYSSTESERLQAQASALTDLLHEGTAYPPGSRILEAGCGVGAQTVALAERSPGAQIVAVDRSESSLARARHAAEGRRLTNVEFHQADLFELPVEDASFDHLFVCFVLEHVAEPERLMRHLMRSLKPGATITVIEGDHGSAFFYPDNADARHAIDCLVELQARGGGNAMIGRELYPLMLRCGVQQALVAPRVVYADAAHPELVEGFTLATFTAMVEGVEEAAIQAGLVDIERWRRGIAGLRRAAEPDGTFSYTFFKGVGVMPA